MSVVHYHWCGFSSLNNKRIHRRVFCSKLSKKWFLWMRVAWTIRSWVSLKVFSVFMIISPWVQSIFDITYQAANHDTGVALALTAHVLPLCPRNVRGLLHLRLGCDLLPPRGPQQHHHGGADDASLLRRPLAIWADPERFNQWFGKQWLRWHTVPVENRVAGRDRHCSGWRTRHSRKPAV